MFYTTGAADDWLTALPNTNDAVGKTRPIPPTGISNNSFGIQFKAHTILLLYSRSLRRAAAQPDCFIFLPAAAVAALYVENFPTPGHRVSEERRVYFWNKRAVNKAPNATATDILVDGGAENKSISALKLNRMP